MIAIYARQSIERPDSVSIDAQVQQCTVAVPGESQVYSDAGYSGKNTKRPAFEHMMRDIKAGKISAVVSYRLDRISRNIIDFANLLNSFEAQGVKYVSATEQFDTSTPMGRAMIYIVMVFAQLERETIATRISDNYRFRATRGLFMGGNTPFGYDSHRTQLDGKKISVIEPNEQAETLKRIFDKYASGESMISISHELNQEGSRTAMGKPWVSNSVNRILRNITPCCADEGIYHYLVSRGYTVTNSLDDFDGQHGMCLFFKCKNRNQPSEIADQVAVIGLHKPLISSDQYIRVQRMLNAPKPAKGKRSQRTFLAGIIRCKECGYSFGIKYTKRGDKSYAYYHCRSRESQGMCGNDIYVPASELETSVVEQCRAYLDGLPSKRILKDDNRVEPYALEAEKLREQIQHLIDNIGRGNSIVDDLLTRRITALQTQIDSISEEAAGSLHPGAIDKTALLQIKHQFSKFDQLNIAQKTDLIQKVIKTIHIDKNGNVDIEFYI